MKLRYLAAVLLAFAVLATACKDDGGTQKIWSIGVGTGSSVAGVGFNHDTEPGDDNHLRSTVAWNGDHNSDIISVTNCLAWWNYTDETTGTKCTSRAATGSTGVFRNHYDPNDGDEYDIIESEVLISLVNSQGLVTCVRLLYHDANNAGATNC